MLYSTQTLELARRFGIIKAVEMLIEAGYPAIDISLDLSGEALLDINYTAIAKEILLRTDAAGIKIIQSHAPFGGGYEHYLGNLVPKFPHAFDFARF